MATASPTAWQHELLSIAGLSTASPQWQQLIDHLVTPAVMVGNTPTARVMMVNGSADEFFPLSAHQATYQAIPTTRRSSLVGNFDHGCYGITGIESAATVEARANLRAEGAQRLWFRHHFGTDAVYATLPAEPTVASLIPSNDPVVCFASCGLAAPCLYVAAVADDGVANLRVQTAHFWWSADAGLFWGAQELSYNSGQGVWDACFNLPYDANTTASYVDVQYETPLLVRFPQERFSFSTVPSLPPGFVPAIRHMDCQLP